MEVWKVSMTERDWGKLVGPGFVTHRTIARMSFSPSTSKLANMFGASLLLI